MYTKNTKTITLKITNGGESDNKIKAILALLGYYNAYGRSINVQNYEIEKAKFYQAINNITYLLDKADGKYNK